MTNINKAFKCAMCATDFPVALTTYLDISDFTMLTKCPKCGNSMQIHFGVIGQSAPAQPQAAAPAATQLDESIFVPPEMPSDDIKQLIEG